jgi:hypothetical protein
MRLKVGTTLVVAAGVVVVIEMACVLIIERRTASTMASSDAPERTREPETTAMHPPARSPDSLRGNPVPVVYDPELLWRNEAYASKTQRVEPQPPDGQPGTG